MPGTEVHCGSTEFGPVKAGARNQCHILRLTRPIFCTNRSESLHRSLGLGQNATDNAT